jgi:hypothetical protein
VGAVLETAPIRTSLAIPRRDLTTLSGRTELRLRLAPMQVFIGILVLALV